MKASILCIVLAVAALYGCEKEEPRFAGYQLSYSDVYADYSIDGTWRVDSLVHYDSDNNRRVIGVDEFGATTGNYCTVVFENGDDFVMDEINIVRGPSSNKSSYKRNGDVLDIPGVSQRFQGRIEFLDANRLVLTYPRAAFNFGGAESFYMYKDPTAVRIK